MESKMIESCAMLFELSPLVRSGIFFIFLVFQKGWSGFFLLSREGNFGLSVLNSAVPSTLFNGSRFATAKSNAVLYLVQVFY